jgi:uncharacterized membrane protein YhaH (DUF805 family)
MSAPDPNYPPPGGAAQGPPAYGAPQPGYGAPGGYPTAYPAAPAGYGAPASGGPMPFPEAVRRVLTQYATFTGRARRSEYWWFFLFNAIVSAVASGIDAVIGFPALQIVAGLALLVPGLAVGARRLHDTGRSGWWQLLALVPIVGVIVLIVWWATDGHPNPNRWGASPKYQGAGY